MARTHSQRMREIVRMTEGDTDIYTELGISEERKHPGNTAEHSLTDEAGEAEENIMQTGWGTDKIRDTH